MEVMFRSEHAENAEELLAYLDKMRDEIEQNGDTSEPDLIPLNNVDLLPESSTVLAVSSFNV